MSDDSDYIQAQLLRHAEHERIRNALEPDDRVRRAQLDQGDSFWWVFGGVIVVAVICALAWLF